jgi:hypothetical protein
MGTALILALAAGGQPVMGSAGQLDGALPTEESASLSVVSKLAAPDWIVRQSDNICGLKNARQLSNPGKVDFSSLYDSTPEAKKIKRDGIDPNSPEGSQLRAAAYERIRKACEQVMTDRSLCSVWKSIRSRSGKAAQDVTETVRGLL